MRLHVSIISCCYVFVCCAEAGMLRRQTNQINWSEENWEQNTVSAKSSGEHATSPLIVTSNVQFHSGSHSLTIAYNLSSAISGACSSSTKAAIEAAAAEHLHDAAICSDCNPTVIACYAADGTEIASLMQQNLESKRLDISMKLQSGVQASGKVQRADGSSAERTINITNGAELEVEGIDTAKDGDLVLHVVDSVINQYADAVGAAIDQVEGTHAVTDLIDLDGQKVENQVSVSGDPHAMNRAGEAFDMRKPGQYRLMRLQN